MKNNYKFTYNTALVGIMTALLTSGKMVLSFLPNIEIVSFMIIMFSVYFGRKTLLSVFAFVLIEGLIFGFGIWWVSYVYIWPLLCFIGCIVRKKASRYLLTVLSAMFGFFFGFLSSFTYIFIGTANPGIGYAVTWWIASVPFDLIHGFGNLAVMLCLYKPVSGILKLVTEHK